METQGNRVKKNSILTFAFTSKIRQKNRQSIFVRLFVYFVSSSLLIIVLIGMFYYEYARQATEKRLNEQLMNSLRESVSLFEIGYQSPLQSNLKMLVSTPSMNNFLMFQKAQSTLIRFDIEKQFSQLIRSRPEFYRSIRFIDAFGVENVVVEGRIRRRNYHSITTAYNGNSIQVELKKIFTQLKQGASQQILFSQPFKVKQGQFLFYAAIAKPEPEIGGFGGILVIECDLSSYIESLAAIRTYGYPIAWLLTPEGEIIVKPADDIPQHDPRSEAGGVQAGTLADTLAGKSSAIARRDLYPGVSPAGQPFLSVVLSIPREIFRSQNFNILKTTLFIALVAIVFTFLVAWVVSRKITHPVTELVRASQQLASGEYSTRSTLQDSSEIGELSMAFNHMAEMLEQSMQSLGGQLSSRISAEQALQHSNEFLQLILNSTGEGIFGIDTGGICTFCNASALKLLDYSKEQEMIGQNMHTTLQHCYAGGEPYPQDKSLIFKTTQSDQVVHTNNEVFWRADKKSIPVEYRAHPVKQAGRIVGAVVSFSDITERKQQDQKIIYQAHYDMLTGLPNRFLAMDRLEQLLRNAARHKCMASVLFIDLDGFKKVNDMLGHEMGDKLLVESAQRLSACLRDEDTVGRLGGDEFIVLLANLNNELDARPVTETILETFRHPFKIEGHEVILTTSIGIAVYPCDSERSAELLRNADIAMYESKQSGRNTYHFFTQELNTGIQRRLEMEEQLHHALARREFYLVYQPVVDIQTMDITGAEVLLRWNSERLGAVGPDEFIPITEQTGLITGIGDYVLRESIAQTARWQKKYQRDFKISVNVSPLQLHDQNLFADVNSLLQEYGLDGQSLQVELTEGVLMNRNQTIAQVLELMHEAQINIAMDDFGTGYSSLSYLRSFPFDSLKIDQSFVHDIHLDSDDMALVLATLNMSHALSLTVIAEGIETTEQLQFLAQAGCEYGQGYLFSKPVMASEFEALFLQGHSLNID